MLRGAQGEAHWLHTSGCDCSVPCPPSLPCPPVHKVGLLAGDMRRGRVQRHFCAPPEGGYLGISHPPRAPAPRVQRPNAACEAARWLQTATHCCQPCFALASRCARLRRRYMVHIVELG
jgi:hypothetical protein